jgi:hypothetical protein
MSPWHCLPPTMLKHTLSRAVGARPASFGMDGGLLVPSLSIGPRLTILSADGHEDYYIAFADPLDYSSQQITPERPVFVSSLAL